MYPIPDKLTAGLKYTFKVCNLHYTAIFKKYSLCVTHLPKPGTFKTGFGQVKIMNEFVWINRNFYLNLAFGQE